MKKPELLAPAGSMASALAAFDAGADAVYAGLPKFNARERGENFTEDSMARLIAYARKNGRKVYVTLNTVLKEEELPELVETLAALRRLGPDALIVQDLGVALIARRYFPELVLHASTQMGFHNSAGIEIAEKLGFRRVILERQITMEELAQIRAKTTLELEVFVHGALCCSLSGQCLFSSYLGGASGNRGKCKQPCRRRYFAGKGNGFFFSPQDLCALELLPQLMELGVASFKIEGRLRQPDYVSQVTGAYRAMIDAEGRPDRALMGELHRKLGKACGRKWSTGFFSEESTAGLIQHQAMGAAGMLCGQVDEIRDNGFGFVTGKRIHLGDRLRLQETSSEEGAALTVTRMFSENQSVRKVSPGDRVFICCDKPARERSLVFKIGESFSDYSGRIAALPAPKTKIGLVIALSANEIVVETTNSTLDPWKRGLSLAPAARHPLTAETLAAEFAAADSPLYEVSPVSCSIEGALFFPAAELKALRREYWAWAHEELSRGGVFDPAAPAMERFRRDYLARRPAELPEMLTETVAVSPNGAQPGSRKAVLSTGIYEINKLTEEAILPEFCPEDRLDSLRRAIARAREQGICRFRVTSLYGFALFGKLRAEELLVASAPIPVANSFAAEALRELGAGRALAHIELERGAIEALRDHSALPLELYRLGRPPLLVTRAKLPVEGIFRDNRGQEFMARYDHRDRLSRVYAKEEMSIPRLRGMYDFYDLTLANWNPRESTTFNFEGGLM